MSLAHPTCTAPKCISPPFSFLRKGESDPESYCSTPKIPFDKSPTEATPTAMYTTALGITAPSLGHFLTNTGVKPCRVMRNVVTIMRSSSTVNFGTLIPLPISISSSILPIIVPRRQHSSHQLPLSRITTKTTTFSSAVSPSLSGISLTLVQNYRSAYEAFRDVKGGKRLVMDDAYQLKRVKAPSMYMSS